MYWGPFEPVISSLRREIILFPTVSVCHPNGNNSMLECLKDFIRIWHHTFQKPKQRTDATEAKDFHHDVMTAHLVLPSPDLQTFS